MGDEKLLDVPHMTDIIKVLKDELLLKSLLKAINEKRYCKEEAANFLMNLGNFKSEETSKRYIGSLSTYKFLLADNNGQMSLSDFSLEYFNGTLTFPEYIIKCLCGNLEWAHFLPNIYNIVMEHGPLRKTDIILYLGEGGYDISKRETIERYLGEILPVLDKAEVIEYKNNEIFIGKINKNKLMEYARINQKELLKILKLAQKRRIPKPSFLKIYDATVKAHLPLRENRRLISKIQADIDSIRNKKFKEKDEEENQITESKWILIDPLKDWQRKFLDLWLSNKRGIAKVVTGAGKTHLAMAIIQKMKEEFDNLHVTIIVPTIVLMEQWRESLIKKLQISPNDIGLKGGDYKDNFENKKILIIVINSAIKEGFIENETADLENNLLIVDECHRAGALEFRNIFKSKRKWDLGLSATPEREMDTAFEDVLVKQLGPIIGEYTYNDARNDNIIPKFNIYNYAVILNNQEKNDYTKITKEIQKIVDRLRYRYPQLNDPKIKMEIVLKSLQSKYPLDKDLFLYFQKTKERKYDILYPAENRKKFVNTILKRVIGEKKNVDVNLGDSPISVTPEDQVIVFHEVIDEINSLYLDLDSKEVSIYHSGFPHSLNRIGMDLYRSGQTKILLSVKALIEGVDVPKTNIGIIMASSSSQTQRIQSLGRVLRKAEGKNETNLFIVYVKNTTDERIYHKIDWDKIVGKGNIHYRMWTEFGEVPIEPPQYKEKPKTEELDFIDENMLEEGCIYPGKYDGVGYSFDSYGKLFKNVRDGREYIEENVDKLWQIFRKYKSGGGKLIFNELGHILIKLNKRDKLETIYLGSIKNYIKDFNKYISEVNSY